MPAAKKKTRKRTPKPAAVPHLSQTETMFAHLLIKGQTPEEAAEWMGLSGIQAAAYAGRASVKKYMEHYRALFAQRMVDAEISVLLAKKITRESLAELLFSLAIMPPERTKGSIDGQIKAVVEATQLLGLKFDPTMLPAHLQGLSDEELRKYAVASPVPN